MLRALAVSVVLSCALAACGGSPKPAVPEPPPPPPAAAASCEDVSAHLVALLHPADESGAAELATRCNEDQWSAEARACFVGAKDEAAVSGCMDLLTPAQRDAQMGAGDDATAPGGPPAGVGADAPPAPPSPAPPHTRGPVQKGSGGADPCMGGEADPCMGGE